MGVPAVLARRLGEQGYRERVARGLTSAYARADAREVELSALRAVVFSDHHRGKGDGADDFRRSEPAYCAALGWYLEQDFELWLLGDVEELWENRPGDVVDHYCEVLALEREFGERLWRFYGNHDMAWHRAANVERFLARRLPRAEVREALKVTVTDRGEALGTLFLVHGHQGTIDSGSMLLTPLSRFVVRFVWARLQRARGFANTSPATDAVLRSKHDRAMAAWADEHPERLVLLAGHTHHPVFPGELPPDLPALAAAEEERYRAAVAAGDRVEAARAARELARVRAARADDHQPLELERPCYFNTGCCSFSDGDVTGLELSDGEVRLVRWLDRGGAPAPKELARADLRTVLGSVVSRPAPR